MKRKEITEFNEAFGYPAPIKPTTSANHSLRAKLIIEELEEYRDACKSKNIVEIADAIGDMLYLVLGAAVEHGIEIEPVFNEIHLSNMSKLGEDGKPIYREDGKVLKGSNYFKPNISKTLVHSMNYKPGVEWTPDKTICELDVEVEKYVNTVVDVTANYFDITVNSLAGPSRKQPIAIARHIISYLCYKRYTYWSVFGKELSSIIHRDRTSFIHGNKLVGELINYDEKVELAVKDIIKTVTIELG
jgi:predicted HAD superfamily Cof-like phosphohydrolase